MCKNKCNWCTTATNKENGRVDGERVYLDIVIATISTHVISTMLSKSQTHIFIITADYKSRKWKRVCLYSFANSVRLLLICCCCCFVFFAVVRFNLFLLRLHVLNFLRCIAVSITVIVVALKIGQCIY